MGRHLTVSEKAARESWRGRLDAVLFGATAALLAWTAVSSLGKGVFIVRFGREVLRSEEPVWFWCFLLGTSVLSIGLVLLAIFRWREGTAANGGMKFTRIKRS